MTQIKPFKAIRPSRDKAYLVATRPYYTYKKHVLTAKLESNPYTYLHVINPEFHADDRTEPNTVERYQKSRDKLEEFITAGIFIKDETDSLYLYRQTKNGHAFLGLIGGASVEQYNSGHIKKHEATITSREKHFSDYLSVVECNAEPVLLFHEENKELNNLLNKLSQERPEYEFSSTQQIKHEVWLVNSPADLKQIQEIYAGIENVYIADGHHRCASSARYSEKIGGESSEIRNHFLAYFISETNMDILDYNRLIHDLNGLTEAEFIHALKETFTLTEVTDPVSFKRTQKKILLYLDHHWYSIHIEEDQINEDDVVNSLDTAILTNMILNPILGVKDLKTDNRVSFINGAKGLAGIENEVDLGKAICGFALAPVSVDQLKAVADKNEIMPPKSTWIEPKLRSGLTMYPLNND
ncbi:MAG: hypothetical protein ACI857_001459 [Arenicella sp.]